MANVEFKDNSVKVSEAVTDALIAGLYEVAGELEAQTVRNSRQGHQYGDIQARELWKHQVDEGEMMAMVGSPYEAGYWEEFGTGEHALNGDGRQGWWVYIEGQESGNGGKSYPTQEEAEKAANFLRKVAKLDAYATNGIDPNRPLHRAFQSLKPNIIKVLKNKMKGME